MQERPPSSSPKLNLLFFKEFSRSFKIAVIHPSIHPDSVGEMDDSAILPK